MKNLYLLTVFLTAVQYVSGQNQWAWMNGDKSANVISNYGSPGKPALSNIPGGRIGAATWTDKDGNLWLFGGNGKGEGSRVGYLNDLWKYDPSSGMWTWIGGSKTINTTGIYTNKGSASAKNLPGARMNAVTWTDSHGNFWLFGGEGMKAQKEKQIGGNNGGSGNGGNGKMKEEQNIKVDTSSVPVYTDPFAYFADVIRGKITLPRYGVYSLENNLRVVQILDAARESARTGKTIYLKKR